MYGASKQKQFEKELKLKWLEGKQIKGQQKLTSGVCQCKRLTDFTEPDYVRERGSKRCHDSICLALEQKNISCDVVDVDALIDDMLSCNENRKAILESVGKSKRKEDRYYQDLYLQFQQDIGRSKVKMPCVPPIKVKAHCRKCPKIKVKAYQRSCPIRKIK